MAISALKTVTSRYKAVSTQLKKNPYKYKDESNEWHFIPRNLEWLIKPVYFARPQIDLVRRRDYSFLSKDNKLSINTLSGRVKVDYDVPECFKEYFAGDKWEMGTSKLLELNGEWYLHISVTREIEDVFDRSEPSHVVGIDRGLRFFVNTYDESENTDFVSGRKILAKRDNFSKVRAELQSKGTKSAKRRLKAISGRENRWMSDVNHQLSRALVQEYGPNTLFVLEDLTGVSFNEDNLAKRNKAQHRDLRAWSFYQFEQYLEYKAHESGSEVVKLSGEYTSQRCPKCGRIRKENRNHQTHEYICDCCGYCSNDDRIGAMNIYLLGTLYVSGDNNPRFGVRKVN